VAHKLDIGRILRLLEAAKDDGELHWLSMAVAFNHALRSSEVTDISRLNVADGMLVMKRKKGSNDVCDELVADSHPLLNERDALLDLSLKTDNNQPLFGITPRTFQRWVHRAGERSGLPAEYCHPHMLKHSVLTYLRKTMALDELQDRSGHKSLDSLRVYLSPEKAVTDALVRTAFRTLAAD
jgi:integrase